MQIALAGRVGVSLSAVIDHALGLLAAKLTEPPERTRERILDLFQTRLSTTLAARGLRGDVIDAVLAGGFDAPVAVRARAEAVTALMRRPDWEPLIVTFKRAINILTPDAEPRVAPERFVDDAERALHAETERRGPRVRAAVAAGDYVTALTEFAGLRPSVDRFFDAVMVMDRDTEVRRNRLALLKALEALVLPIADLRRIQTASEDTRPAAAS